MFGRNKRREAWAEVARVLGGEHHVPTKWWRSGEFITASLHGVVVKLDTYVVSTGTSSQTFTRIVAPIAHQPGVKSQVYRQGFWSTIGKLVGMRDVSLGDAAFDAMHVVRSEKVAVVRRWWTEGTRALMSAVGEGRVSTDRGEVKLVASGRWSSTAKMSAGMRLVGELAARDLYGLGVLQAVGGALVQPALDRPRVELDTGVRVVVMAEDRDDSLVMSARTSDALPHEPLVIEVALGRASESSRLPQAAQLHLAKVGSGQLTIGSASAFLWNDFETDPDRLRAGAALLGAFSARDGVYR